MMTHHPPRKHHPSLNSFAQWPVQGEATPNAAETPQPAETPQAAETTPATETPQAAEAPQAEVAPSRPIDKIADRFPAMAEFMTATRSGTEGATLDAADSTAVAVADPAPATEVAGTTDADSADEADMCLTASVLLALGTAPVVAWWWWFRGRRRADRGQDRLLMFDEAIASARRRPLQIEVALE